jgi:quinohemoprotein ethanol dehydrogenase
MRFRATLLSCAALSGSFACGSANTLDRVDDARLVAADADSANWLTYGRTYSEQRFSPLKQINDSTVGRLGLVWSHELPTTRGVEATPIVVDGVIYTTSTWSVAYAYDAATGRELWSYDPRVDRSRARTICCDAVNRGLALYRGKLYLATLDGRLIAIDARTGRAVWDVKTIDQSQPYAITGAPRIARGRVIIGNAGAEFGVRGYVSAFDAETGKLAWRVYSVPSDPSKRFETPALEAAAKTWHGEFWKAGGGGTAWDPIVYDPELDLVYFGTGNGTAWYRDLRSPGGGDNLYLASILAVRASDGQYAWHYQVTPGDNWDFDRSNQHPPTME